MTERLDVAFALSADRMRTQGRAAFRVDHPPNRPKGTSEGPDFPPSTTIVSVPVYADETRVADARAAYFEANGFAPDGGYDEDWVKLKVGPFPVVFPNTSGRKAAVPLLALRPHHIEDDAVRITSRLKGGPERVVPLEAPVRLAIDRWLEHRGWRDRPMPEAGSRDAGAL